MKEHHFGCPYCGEPISMVLDEEESDDAYIEDCEVCCRPIHLFFKFMGQDLLSFIAAREDDV